MIENWIIYVNIVFQINRNKERTANSGSSVRYLKNKTSSHAKLFDENENLHYVAAWRQERPKKYILEKVEKSNCP